MVDWALKINYLSIYLILFKYFETFDGQMKVKLPIVVFHSLHALSAGVAWWGFSHGGHCVELEGWVVSTSRIW